MKMLKLATIALITMFAASAFASEPTDRDVMTDVLRGIDTVPNAAQLTERFPKGEALLVAIAVDESENLYVRKRATTLLSTYGTAEAARGLQTIAEQPELRPYAVYTLARTFGGEASAELVAAVAVYLKDDSKEVREWVVRGLRWMRHDDARDALSKVASDTSRPDLSELARRSLTKWRPGSSQTVH